MERKYGRREIEETGRREIYSKIKFLRQVRKTGEAHKII